MQMLKHLPANEEGNYKNKEDGKDEEDEEELLKRAIAMSLEEQ